MVTSHTLTNKPTYIHTEESVMCDVKTNDNALQLEATHKNAVGRRKVHKKGK